MPRKSGSGGPTCAWTLSTGQRCKRAVERSGEWCHSHRSLVSDEERRRARRERAMGDEKRAEARSSCAEFARVALLFGLAAPETRVAFDRMVQANSENPPVPEWLRKP